MKDARGICLGCFFMNNLKILTENVLFLPEFRKKKKKKLDMGK